MNCASPLGRAERGRRGNGQSAPGPERRIGRKDLQDPDRDETEPGRLAPDDEPGRNDHDARARPVQLLSTEDNKAQTTTQEAEMIVTDSWVTSKTKISLIALVRMMLRRGGGPRSAPETAQARWP